MTVRITALSCIINCDTPVCSSVKPNPEHFEIAKNTISNVPKISLIP